MKNLDLIERYFENSLGPKDQKLFNDLLQSDPEFKHEFLFQKDLKQAIAANQQEELKATLNTFEVKSDKNSKRHLFSKKWLIAASLLIFVSVGFWAIQKTYYPSNETLYSEYFQPYRNTVHPVVRGENINTIEYKAFAAYEAKNYYKAINLFNSVETPEAPYILYYKGLCFMSVDKSLEAIELLTRVSSDPTEGASANFKEKSNWYLALAHLKEDDSEKAVSYLNLVLTNTTSDYKKEEAQEILNYLQ